MCHYCQTLADSLSIQRLNASAAACAAIAGILAFVALVAYTNEASRSRKVAEDQLEATIMPVVSLEVASGDFVVHERLKVDLQFRNVGAGPAFNVVVDTVVGRNGVTLHIEGVALMESRVSLPAKFDLIDQGQKSGLAREPSLLDYHFANNIFPDGTPLVVRCKGLSGRLYCFHHVVRCIPNVKIWTEFVRFESGEI